MKVSLLQHDVVWTDPSANMRVIEGFLGGMHHQDTDLLVLPEMFSTGFVMEPGIVAERCSAETVSWMSDIASRLDMAVAGSISVHTDDGFRNRLYFICPDGTISYYDKKHLFTYSGEDKAYVPGADRVIVTWRGIRFLLSICYDLRFPVWMRCRDDYDAVICVANWPVSRRMSWDVLLRARAIENQCYVLGVNRIGRDSMCDYDGGTVVVNPYGQVVASCNDHEPALVTTELDMSLLSSFREKFPVGSDADEFEIK